MTIFVKATKNGQVGAEISKTIAEQQTFNGIHKDWAKARKFLGAYLYKEKKNNGIPRSYLI